jgi:hypothetical protein
MGISHVLGFDRGDLCDFDCLFEFWKTAILSTVHVCSTRFIVYKLEKETVVGTSSNMFNVYSSLQCCFLCPV